jgi:hypothetical protein
MSIKDIEALVTRAYKAVKADEADLVEGTKIIVS